MRDIGRSFCIEMTVDPLQGLLSRLLLGLTLALFVGGGRPLANVDFR